MNAPNNALLARQQLYRDMDPLNLTPLWEVLHALVPPQPASPCVPALWKYGQVRPFLMRAGQAITAEEAVRRVLILENPKLRGQSAVTQSLYAGLQLILPGEVAPSHRHTQSALRFIVEGSGAYTAVDGERTAMRPGDFIITPSWTFHDHGSEADGPVVWLDGLDIPMIRFFDAGFAQNGTARAQEVTRTEGTSFARYGHNMAPVRHDPPFGGKTSPLFSYPYERSREALQQLERLAPIDPWDGVKLRYLNPLTGGSPMPTMATFMQKLPAGFAGKGWRQTDGAVYSVVEGEAVVHAESPRGETWRFEVAARDHFVIPSWHTARLESAAGCVLFSFSDRPVHQALGIHQEERLS
ncbi:gentisate 1,2-dioxygenase [Ramlibacter tataouinensis]|uniref:Gentisate 1,2-dioxygenase n=1 Tax=Ramlibacter tataouinensis (strain ATCC BAA-407 / DSM 14655 / LMG 21543 / TTB310) TaxID=365046 RepID=F5XVX0_RAMTT|nr:gentisate 1,2-dioxygenase [Ramlibacter tataouinensis]AEG92883.1 gentisate 1,2-dioxygenase-like protein [Ramlibacter tataouinensis TTB310]